MQQLFDQSLFDRMKRAAMLDRTLYDEVEHDLSATNQAVTIVCAVAVVNAISGLLGLMVGAILGGGSGIVWGIIAVIFSMSFTVVGWVIWSYLTFWVGTTVFKGTATPGELLRTLGFASTPGLLNIVGFIPCLGPLISFGALIWMIVAGVIAVRQALDVDTGQAVITVVLAAIPLIMLQGLFWFIGVLGAVFAAAMR